MTGAELVDGQKAVIVNGITIVGKFFAIAIGSGNGKLVSAKKGQQQLWRALK